MPVLSGHFVKWLTLKEFQKEICMVYNLDMRFEWNFWDFVKEYLLKVIVLWIAIISAFSTVVYFVIKFWVGEDIHIKYWILIIVVGVFIAQMVAYYRITRRQIPGERIEQYLESISKLREEGVNKLQNVDINTIRTAEDFKKFQTKFVEWQSKLISEVEKVSPSQASIFQVLGTYQPVTMSVYKGNVKKELMKMLGIITEYTKRIKEFVDRFSLENLENRVKK